MPKNRTLSDKFTRQTIDEPAVTMRVSIPVDHSLREWLARKDAQEALLTRAKDLNAKSIEFKRKTCEIIVTCPEDTVSEAVSALITLELQHQAQLRMLNMREQRVAERMEKTQKEIREGRHVEFVVPLDVLGLVIGRKGEHIEYVKQLTNVSFVNVNRDSGLVQIQGKDASAVRRARDMLEFDCQEIEINPHAVPVLIGKGGEMIRQIRNSSGVDKLEIQDPTSNDPLAPRQIFVMGRKKAVHTALTLIRARIQHFDSVEAQKLREKELQEQLAAMDARFQTFSKRSPRMSGSGSAVREPYVEHQRTSKPAMSDRTHSSRGRNNRRGDVRHAAYTNSARAVQDHTSPTAQLKPETSPIETTHNTVSRTERRRKAGRNSTKASYRNSADDSTSMNDTSTAHKAAASTKKKHDRPDKVEPPKSENNRDENALKDDNDNVPALSQRRRRRRPKASTSSKATSEDATVSTDLSTTNDTTAQRNDKQPLKNKKNPTADVPVKDTASSSKPTDTNLVKPKLDESPNENVTTTKKPKRNQKKKKQNNKSNGDVTVTKELVETSTPVVNELSSMKTQVQNGQKSNSQGITETTRPRSRKNKSK